MKHGVTICDVALRDGLQSQSESLSTIEKLAVLRAMENAGLKEFELGSFVRPDRVPQMADTKELFETVGHSASTYIALTPNMRGFEAAVAAEASKVALVVACSDTLSSRNFGKTTSEVLKDVKEIVKKAKEQGILTRVYISGIFGCPYEGKIPQATVMEVVECVAGFSPDEICIADTTGAGNPAEAETLFEKIVGAVGVNLLAVHLHDTRAMGMVLAWVAYKAGIRRFDGSLGGLGGCPFAPGASGNIATEDLVVLFEQAGIDTGVDLDRLVVAVKCLQSYMTRPVGGRTLKWIDSKIKGA